MIGRIELSDPLRPGRSTLVESENKSATPSSPAARSDRYRRAAHRLELVDFEIARMYDQPGRRANRERHRIGRGVVTRTAPSKRPQLDFRPGMQQPQIGTRQPVFGRPRRANASVTSVP